MRQPGKLDQRVRIETYSDSRDGPFASGGGWTTVATVWADVTPVNGNESVEADSQTVLAKYRVTMRKRSDLTGEMRFIWTSNGNLAMNIRELPDPGKRALYQDIYVTTGGAD